MTSLSLGNFTGNDTNPGPHLSPVTAAETERLVYHVASLAPSPSSQQHNSLLAYVPLKNGGQGSGDREAV